MAYKITYISAVIYHRLLNVVPYLCQPNPEGGGYIVFDVDPGGVSIGVGVGVGIHFFVSVHYLLNQLMNFDQTRIYTLLGEGE